MSNASRIGTGRKICTICSVFVIVTLLISSLSLGKFHTAAAAASDPWGKGEILNYIFFPDREMGLDPKEVQNYYAWKLAATGTTDEAQLQKDLNLTDQQMTQLRQLGMEECSHIQHLTLPSGWTSSSVSASINASFATIDNNTRAVLGSQYDAFRQWVQNWEQREEQYQKQWFEEQVRLINTEGGPRGQEGRQPVPPRLPEERTNYDRRERSVEEIRMADPNPTDRPTTTDIAQGNALDSVPESGILGVPLRQQGYVYYCGPASAQELLDYEWGYTGSSSKYSQSTLATYMQTDPVNGTYVYKVTDGLNYYRDPNKSPLSTWNSGYIYSDETTTATTLYDDTKQAVSQENHGVVYRVNTCPLPGQSDVWGEPYGLVGYYDSGSGNYSSLIHYVAGRGYTTYSNGRHRVTYLDSYNHAYAWGNPYGYQILDTRNMARCVNAAGSSPGWIIW